MTVPFSPGDHVWHSQLRLEGRVVDTHELWGQTLFDVWLLDRGTVVRARGGDLAPVGPAERSASDRIAYVVAAARVAEALTEDVLLAPLAASVIPLPHQGKTDAFHRLLSLLDDTQFPDEASVPRERIRPYVIRTEKRQAVDALGQPLFVPRNTRLVAVTWEARHACQRQLYDSVGDYIREGYNQAIKEKRPYIGFLLILMQRLVTSSTRAIRSALERRLDVLQHPDEPAAAEPLIADDEWPERDGEEQVTALFGRATRGPGERAERGQSVARAGPRC